AAATANTDWMRRSIAKYDDYYRRVNGSTSSPSFSLDVATFGLLAADSPTRPVDASTPIDAILNPLLENRNARAAVDGTTASALVGGTVWLSRFVVASVAMSTDLRSERASSTAADLRPEQLYIRSLVRNVAITIGRDY